MAYPKKVHNAIVFIISKINLHTNAQIFEQRATTPDVRPSEVNQGSPSPWECAMHLKRFLLPTTLKGKLQKFIERNKDSPESLAISSTSISSGSTIKA